MTVQELRDELNKLIEKGKAGYDCNCATCFDCHDKVDIEIDDLHEEVWI